MWVARRHGVGVEAALGARYVSKEDLLRASIRYLADRNVADIISDCAKTSDLAAQRRGPRKPVRQPRKRAMPSPTSPARA